MKKHTLLNRETAVDARSLDRELRVARTVGIATDSRIAVLNGSHRGIVSNIGVTTTITATQNWRRQFAAELRRLQGQLERR